MIYLLGFNLLSLVSMFFYGVLASLGFPGGMVTLVVFSTFAVNLSELGVVVVVIYLAAVIGDIVAYEVARKLSKPVRKKLRKLGFFNKHELRVIKLIEGYGFFIVFITRFFLLSLCAPVSYLSGLERFSRKKYYSAVFTGEILYALIYPTLGYFVGSVIASVFATVNDILAVVILGFVAIYLLWVLMKKIRR